MEQPIVITNREELLFMLSEAAQLEHMLLCEYLFAAFSLKSGGDEGLTPDQREAVTRWERVISAVAVQEMLHLALVNNMLTAIGGAPYLTRPNFPQRAAYFPPGVQLALLPFGEHALRHFLYLERPEGMALEDAPEFAIIGAAAPVTPNDTIVPTLEQFATVGHLYRGIERGFATLIERYGEGRVFIGPAGAQATARHFGWPELIAVTDLASATTAIETIVEEGEGARGDWTQAHYGTFLRVLEEYKAITREHPDFAPARPVTAGFCRPSADVSATEMTPLTDPTTMRVASLFNASYEVMLQVLYRFFMHTEETDAELHTLSRTTLTMMRGVVKPLGQLLTTLPVGSNAPGMTAGPSFEIYRTGYLLPHRDAAWAIMHERLVELAGYGEHLAKEHGLPDAVNVAASLRDMANDFARRHGGRRPHAARADSAVAATPMANDDRIGNQPVQPAIEDRTMVSFARDIRPLFRDNDVQSMSWAFDLGNHNEVQANAERIYAQLSGGTMPCDAPWPRERIALFKQWMDAGCPV